MEDEIVAINEAGDDCGVISYVDENERSCSVSFGYKGKFCNSYDIPMSELYKASEKGISYIKEYAERNGYRTYGTRFVDLFDRLKRL